MKRVFIGILTATLVVVFAFASGAEAKGKKKRGKKKKGPPESTQIVKSMGDLKWGTSEKKLLKSLTDKVKDRYRPIVAKTKDAVEEDRLRNEAKEEMRRIRKSRVEFRGKSTGWDVSFLAGEFTHGNDETMIVVRDKNSQNFYFFIGGRLWKWYKAFDADVFPAGNFAAFAGALQRKFGKAKEVTAPLRPGDKDVHWLEWQDKTTRLRAVDQTAFYGFYCLVFEDRATLKNLARLRTNQPSRGKKSHGLVDAVTSREETQDSSSNIVDRITGKIRNREDAPEDDGGKRGRRRGRSSTSSSRTSSSSSSGSGDSDPLRGLGL